MLGFFHMKYGEGRHNAVIMIKDKNILKNVKIKLG